MTNRRKLTKKKLITMSHLRKKNTSTARSAKRMKINDNIESGILPIPLVSQPTAKNLSASSNTLSQPQTPALVDEAPQPPQQSNVTQIVATENVDISDDYLDSKTVKSLLPFCKDETNVVDLIEQIRNFNPRIKDKQNFLSIVKSKIQGEARVVLRREINKANSTEEIIELLSDEFFQITYLDEALVEMRNATQFANERVRQFGLRLMQKLFYIEEILISNSNPSGLVGELSRAKEDAISTFIKGLKNREIRVPLTHNRPKTLRDAIHVACRIENVLDQAELPSQDSTNSNETKMLEYIEPDYFATVNKVDVDPKMNTNKIEQPSKKPNYYCYKCRGRDHLRKDCPNRRQRSSKTKN